MALFFTHLHLKYTSKYFPNFIVPFVLFLCYNEIPSISARLLILDLCFISFSFMYFFSIRTEHPMGSMFPRAVKQRSEGNWDKVPNPAYCQSIFSLEKYSLIITVEGFADSLNRQVFYPFLRQQCKKQS